MVRTRDGLRGAPGGAILPSVPPSSRGFAAIVALVVSIAIPARAFERATVTGDPSTELAWPRRDLDVRLAADTSGDVAPGPLREAVERSFATWSGAGGCTDVEIFEGGAVTGLESNLMGGDHDGENRIVFREEAWPADLGPETLAITTLVYRRSTGEILDADIDVNGVDHTWSVDAVPPAGASDVENTMTHEVGHLLGFAHAPEPASTMYARADLGDVTKRDLDADDVSAVCYVYPRGAMTPGGDRPRPPLASGCAVGVGAPGGSLFAVALAVALGATLPVSVRARRRRARAR